MIEPTNHIPVRLGFEAEKDVVDTSHEYVEFPFYAGVLLLSSSTLSSMFIV
jgi:hypothetical protein